MEKWNREKFNIKTTYDDKGDFEKGYKLLKLQMEKERQQRRKEDPEDSEEEPPRKRQKADPATMGQFLA